MKATIAGLAAVLVSLCSLNGASAQSPYQYPYPYANPYPVQPVAFAGPAAGAPATGGGGCNAAQPRLLSRFAIGHKDGGNGGCSTCGTKGTGICAAIKSCLCRPYPSYAPVCGGQLAFPNSPYVRSPRDYFMYEDP